MVYDLVYSLYLQVVSGQFHIAIDIVHCIFPSVVSIGLENSSYNTSEDAGSVVVCAQVTSGTQLGRVFAVDLATQDGTAQSTGRSPYIQEIAFRANFMIIIRFAYFFPINGMIQKRLNRSAKLSNRIVHLTMIANQEVSLVIVSFN